MIRRLGPLPDHNPEANHGPISLWESERLVGQPGLVHFMTLADQNMSDKLGPDHDRAAVGREYLCHAHGLPFERLTVPRQVHGNQVVALDEAIVGAGRVSRDLAVPHVDGLYTTEVDHPLMCLTADCPVVLVFEPDVRAVGLVHAGWRGTLSGAVCTLIQRMSDNLGARPAGMLGLIFPSAGPCCYEVKEDVLRIMRDRVGRGRFSGFVRRQGGRDLLDLWSLNAEQMRLAGMVPERIEKAGICTICDSRFCSYRRDGRGTRHAGVFAALAG